VWRGTQGVEIKQTLWTLGPCKRQAVVLSNQRPKPLAALHAAQRGVHSPLSCQGQTQPPGGAGRALRRNGGLRAALSSCGLGAALHGVGHREPRAACHALCGGCQIKRHAMAVKGTHAPAPLGLAGRSAAPEARRGRKGRRK
jgi:hypothetical protein